MTTLEWVGSNWLAVAAIGVPVIVGLYLAAQSTRYLMDHRDFERDRAASIAYLARMEGVHATLLASKDRVQAAQALHTISDAATQWNKASSGTRPVASYFTDVFTICTRAYRNGERGAWNQIDEFKAGNALTRLESIVEDWPYPERRRDVTRRVLTDVAQNPLLPRTMPVDLQVERWMLVSLPSPYRIVQRWRAVKVWVRGAWFDVRQRRLLQRLRDWREVQDVRRRDSKPFHRDNSAAS
jgi:hypothetical protein